LSIPGTPSPEHSPEPSSKTSTNAGSSSIAIRPWIPPGSPSSLTPPETYEGSNPLNNNHNPIKSPFT
jgi:hypothetical protein